MQSKQKSRISTVTTLNNNKYNNDMTPVNSVKLIRQIIVDILIDGLCIIVKGMVFQSNMNLNGCIFLSSIFNNIYLNINTTSKYTFIQRGIILGRFGLFSNIISAIIYVQPFQMLLFCKYILSMAIAMAIISNLRYTILLKTENKFDVNIYQSIMLRVINNTCGVYQQSTIINNIF